MGDFNAKISANAIARPCVGDWAEDISKKWRTNRRIC